MVYRINPVAGAPAGAVDGARADPVRRDDPGLRRRAWACSSATATRSPRSASAWPCCRGFPVIGEQVNGAYLDIHVGGVSFQPAELAKIAIVIFLASYLRDNRQILVTAGRRVLGLTIPPMKQFGPMLVVWGAAMATLLLTRELGTSLMFYGAFLALLVCRHRALLVPADRARAVRPRRLVRGRARQPRARARARLGTPLRPGAVQPPEGGSYQLAQSLFAQADGGLLGTGFDQSLLRLPHQRLTDPAGARKAT